jgi:hypothetical protein
VDQIQSLCRPLTLSKVSLPLDLLINDRRPSWTRAMIRSGKTLEFLPPPVPTKASFDVERLGAGLDALVDWRAGEPEAGSVAKVRWWMEDRMVHLVWEESGVPSSVTQTAESSDRSTWALPLLVRVVLAHDGDFRIESNGGYRLELFWPNSLSTF